MGGMKAILSMKRAVHLFTQLSADEKAVPAVHFVLSLFSCSAVTSISFTRSYYILF